MSAASPLSPPAVASAAESSGLEGSGGRLLVMVATYNERENLPRLLDEVRRQLPQADILVVDDNSPDGTGRWCDEESQRDSRVHCLHRSGKLGLGTATVAGMRYAIGRGYDLLLNMDADFSHHPRHLPAVLAAMEEPAPVDVAIGSRYVPGGEIVGWPWRRHFMSRGVNAYARLLLGLRCRDCSGAFRCYRTSLLRQIDFDAIRSRGYSFQEEILWLCQRQGARFRETPITFADRTLGQSKINAGEARAALWTLLVLGLRRLTG